MDISASEPTSASPVSSSNTTQHYETASSDPRTTYGTFDNSRVGTFTSSLSRSKVIDRIVTHNPSVMSDMSEFVRPSQGHFRPDISLNDPHIGFYMTPDGNMERSFVSSLLGDIEIIDDEGVVQREGTASDEKARLDLIRYDKYLKVLLGWAKLENPGICRKGRSGVTCVNRNLRSVYNWIYTFIVLFFLLCYYCLSMWLCVTPKLKSENDNDDSRSDSTNNESDNGTSYDYEQCSNLVSNYVIDYIINLGLYVSLLWYTRFHRSESIYIALEKVFMRANKSQIGKQHKPKFLRRMKYFVLYAILVGAIGWLSLAFDYLDPQALKFTFSDDNGEVFEKLNDEFNGTNRTVVIVALESCLLIGAFFYLFTNMVLVLHYFWFCLIVTFHIQCLVSDILQRAVPLGEAIRDAQEIQALVSSLNGFPSKVTSLVALMAVDNFLYEMYKMSSLSLDQYDNFIFRAAMCGVWLFTIVCIFIPPCVITEQSRRLRKAAAEMRAFGYPNTITNDLDSFLTYLSIIRIQPKLFFINVKTSWVAASFVISFIVLLLLTKTEILFARIG